MTAPARGWGRTPAAWGDQCDVAAAAPAAVADQVAAAVHRAGPRGVLARGAARSYGDAALTSGGTALRLPVDGPVEVDAQAGTLRAGAGVDLGTLMRHCLAAGWSLPVLPGTRWVTLGGAVAADVHGKDHGVVGSLGRWLQELVLVDGTGTVRVLLPGQEGFRATVGGMGLTGVVLSATLRLLPAPPASLRVRNERAPDLASLVDLLGARADEGRWAVAWVDGTQPGRALGRGIVSSADDEPAGEPVAAYGPTRRLTVPPLPLSAVRPSTARGFDALWWRRPLPVSAQVPLESFFHPLDGLTGWNRAYGPRGFVQYQVVVPPQGGPLLAELVARLQASGAAPFLGVLKRFGAAGDAMLSFPRPGWALALDLPPTRGLAGVLDAFDEVVAGQGGAVYLAKDSRMRSDALPRMYPALPAWREVRDRMDPERRFVSDLDRRLDVSGRA